jgi:hypothetical protein
MEAAIIEESLGFSELLSDMLSTRETQLLNARGSLRAGGRLDLCQLGDDVWLDQFRYD